ncbi:MAG: aldehyde dehydrogenase family protein, partial [bacterium]
MAEKFGLVIDGQQVPSQSGETFEVRNPANTDEIVGVVARGGADDVERAVEAAQRALTTTWWPRLAESRQRGRVLLKYAAMVEERKADLARLLTREQGKVVKESISELDSLINTFDYYAGYGGKITGTVVFA